MTSKEIICASCRHNCGKTPMVERNPKGVCWCNANCGRVITKKYKQCNLYEPYMNQKERNK